MSKFLAGWKTRIFSAVLFLYGLVGTINPKAIDPDTITTALGLEPRGHAVTIIVISLAVAYLRQITTGPAGSQK